MLGELRSVERWHNDSNRGKSKYSGKQTVPNATATTTNPKQNDPRLNSGFRDEISVTNRLSHARGTASSRRYWSKVSVIFVGFSQKLMSKRSWYINSEYGILQKFMGRKSQYFMRTEEF
jgi:hypothetical protein